MQCEGWRRTGGAFTFGPVKWEQCENSALVMLTVVQNAKKEELPACRKCWNEAIENKIEISAVVPLPEEVPEAK
jgi:hypothetical protein